jgi:hypothetical protein
MDEQENVWRRRSWQEEKANAELRDLLREWMVGDGDVAVRYDGFDCYFCGGLQGHTPDCLITRTRAALERTTKP